jgi:hypothetical protein
LCGSSGYGLPDVVGFAHGVGPFKIAQANPIGQKKTPVTLEGKQTQSEKVVVRFYLRWVY